MIYGMNKNINQPQDCVRRIRPKIGEYEALRRTLFLDTMVWTGNSTGFSQILG